MTICEKTQATTAVPYSCQWKSRPYSVGKQYWAKLMLYLTCSEPTAEVPEKYIQLSIFLE